MLFLCPRKQYLPAYSFEHFISQLFFLCYPPLAELFLTCLGFMSQG